jgi:hypothetical protein
MKSPSEFRGMGAILCLFDRKTRNRFVVKEIITIFALGSGRNPDKQCIAIISRIAKKSLGNSNWYKKHRNDM